MSAFVSHEEDYERWEAAAPKAVNTNWTPEQIAAYQGTRLDKSAPWENYMAEQLSPEMEAAVAAYAENVHDDSSNQTKEELHRWQEGNEEVAKEYQWCTPEEYADIQQRFGTIMSHDQLINKLRKECKLKVFYREHPHADKITLLLSDEYSNKKPEIVCWVQRGWMPEYTVMGFDEHGVPLAEKYRGWRTVLLQMILKDIITIEKAHKVFGEANLPCAERYNSILHSYRNRDHKA